MATEITIAGRRFSPWVVLGFGVGAAVLLLGGARAVSGVVTSTRGQKVLDGLAPDFRAKVEEFLRRAKAAGYNITIVSGRRTMDEQQALYDKGRNTSGSIVTNAKPGESAHNFGQAIDFAFVNPITGAASWDESAPWAAVAEIGKSLGMEWGGDWATFRDRPHLETTTWKVARDEYRRSGRVLT